jgi:isoquinoline 1-oxidoreductase beta subunit
VSTQSQTSTQQAAMAASGLPQNKVFVHPMFMGGGFGRRGEATSCRRVETSKKVGAPVKVMWTREDDIQHDFYRPVTYVRMWAALDAAGNPTAWMQRIVQSSLMKKLNPDSLKQMGGVDPISVEGASSLPYDIPNLRVEYTEADPGRAVRLLALGGQLRERLRHRGVHRRSGHRGRQGPYEFRRALLAKHPRQRAVLDMVAEKANWKSPVPAGRGRGIAVHECFGSIIGLVSEVSVTNGVVRVHKNVCVVDCGWVVHPDTIKAQMEGGLAYGLAAALKGEITINKGRVVQNHFGDYQPLRHNEMPQTEVYIMPSVEAPGGIGEPSTAAMAGALVNAVYAGHRQACLQPADQARDLHAEPRRLRSGGPGRSGRPGRGSGRSTYPTPHLTHPTHPTLPDSEIYLR